MTGVLGHKFPAAADCECTAADCECTAADCECTAADCECTAAAVTSGAISAIFVLPGIPSLKLG